MNLVRRALYFMCDSKCSLKTSLSTVDWTCVIKLASQLIRDLLSFAFI